MTRRYTTTKTPRYSVDKLAQELLRLTPFEHEDFRLLLNRTIANMNSTHYDPVYRRQTKPHPNRNLSKAIQREFERLKGRVRASRRDKLLKIKRELKKNEIEIIVIKFAITLTETIYRDNTPNTAKPYERDLSQHTGLINRYDQEGKPQIAQGLRDNPPQPVKTYKEVAKSIKDEYLQAAPNTLSKKTLDGALEAEIKETRKFAYPTRKDEYPVD